jgi:hypothetical protein
MGGGPWISLVHGYFDIQELTLPRRMLPSLQYPPRVDACWDT